MQMKFDSQIFLDIYRHMTASARLDAVEKSLAQRGEVPFYVPCGGHEAVAGLAPHLGEQDWLHCHYRDKALALARGLSIESFFHALLGTDASSSRGRRMPGFVSEAALHVLSTTTVVGNNALQAVGVASAVKDRPGHPIVYCGMGDGSTQQGEFYEAVAEAVRAEAPVLFLVQDNRYALSTPTKGRTFYSLPAGDAETFYGLPIQRIDGTDATEVYAALGKQVSEIRETRKPRLSVMISERLSSHTNSDDQRMYRTEEEIADIMKHANPVKNLRNRLLEEGVEEKTLLDIESDIDEAIETALEKAHRADAPRGTTAAKKELPEELKPGAEEYTGSGKPELTMLEAMREVLRQRLESEDKASLFGEDIADPKGDVFGLTRGLGEAFADRVRNSPLAESTILGISIGRALAGEKPIALFQFADFMPVAYNQLFSELGTLFWRTGGQWEAPVVAMAICGGYRPGLGPYHAQTPTTTMAHIPGIDVFVPSTAGDAAGLLNAATRSERPSVFLYPKNLINDRDRMTSADINKHLVPIGKARIVREGQDLTIVSWGSTMPLCDRVADALAEEGLYAEIIDLRTIYPWDIDTVVASAEKTGRLLVVHEDNYTCGFGAEVLAEVNERASQPIRSARVAQADTYVPYHFGAQMEVLPSFKSVLERAAHMLDYDVEWEEAHRLEAGKVIVNAIGSSPSDETVTITELYVKEGQEVKAGDLIASVEADKATMEISAPVNGTVTQLLLAEGESASVGTPLAELATDEEAAAHPSNDEPGRPRMKRRLKGDAHAAQAAGVKRETKPVILSSICSALASRVMTNDDLVKLCPGWNSDQIRQRTGIVCRHWIDEDESALTLGVKACEQLFEREGIGIRDIDAIICSTGTPPSTTPSLACRILKRLSPEEGETLMPAHDINAACSGFLYALQQAYDMLHNNPDQRILLVTSETLSPVLDNSDPSTFFLFGDAATASLLSCEQRAGNIHAEVKRPVLSALGAEEKILYVPSIQSSDFVQMDGKPVFRIAVRKMIDMLDRVCSQEGMTVEDLDMIVPHQANERIIEAIRKSIKFPTEKVFYYIREYGNTSSNTIPLSLEALMQRQKTGDRVGMTAFGGGFTFAAGMLEVL
jgi:2-oxoisovalerate dehydrogenase E1 component